MSDLELISTFRLVEYFLDVVEHGIWTVIRIDLSDFSHLTIVLNDGHRRIHISIKSLLQTLQVIVGAAAALLTSLKATLHALILRAVEEEHIEEIDLLRHLLLPALQIVFISWKSIDEEFVIARLLQRERNQKLHKFIDRRRMTIF
jgi:hypothetical protein